MAFDQLSSNDKVRLNQFMDDGMKTMQEITDLRDGLKDVAKSLAEEFDVKPALLMKALRSAWKASIDDEKAEIDQVENILEATGRR